MGLLAKTEVIEHAQIFGTNFRDPLEYYGTKLLNKVLPKLLLSML